MSLVLADAEGHELFESARVSLAKPIEMERLFNGYAAALGGGPVPRDLAVGDEGVVIHLEEGPEATLEVEFRHQGSAFWRGGLRPDEVRRVGA